MVKVTLPDGRQLDLAEGATVKDVAERLGLAATAVAGKVNGALVDLSARLPAEAKVQVIMPDDKEGLQVIRHSCAHVMAQAICSIWPSARLVYGPAVEDGFYYDIDLDEPITPADFQRIEQVMAKIAQADLPFVRREMTRQQALARVAGDPYKTDNINRAEGDIISFYSHGDGFEDLCRGPHVPSTGRIGAFKIMSVAGAYWHGDVTKKMLQRVYGTAWPTRQQLDAYLQRLEEAKKRDHRVIGRQLDLFSFHPAGPGFAFIHAKGMVIWNTILDYWRAVHRRYGYVEIKTPIILNEELWHRSGHWDNYKQNMYFTTIDQTVYAIKPMNCPGGCLVYQTSQHSYRQLPLRVSEVGLVHRHEASGVLHGLFRVRQFTQDDAHIFCTPEQIEDEVVGVIDLTQEIYSAFGFKDIHVELSTKPEKHIGSDEIWQIATSALQKALSMRSLQYQINEGEGAFYGPKIDFHIRDCIGRSWQLGTIQLDFSMPQRFGLVYTDKDNTEKTPVMIHRAVLGSFERFLGILIEHYAGSLPVWLAPEQARVLTISERTNQYALDVQARLQQADIRCGVDLSDEKINAKIARAHSDKVPVMLVVGPKEATSGAVNLRVRGQAKQVSMDVGMVIGLVKQAIADKYLDLRMDQIL